MFNKTYKESVINEWQEEVPYIFVLSEDVNRTTGTPIIRVEMTNINRVKEVAEYNMSPICERPQVYTPLRLEAEYDGTQSKLDIVQTLVSAGLSKLQGIFKVEVLEEEDDVTIRRGM